jgi:hypothetical protein
MLWDKKLLAAIQMAMSELSFQNNFTKWNHNGIGKIVILQMVSVVFKQKKNNIFGVNIE